MSTAYAFAAVSAVLRNRLTAYLAAAGVSSSIGGVSVSAQPPDRVGTGAQEPNVLNLYLHRVTRNQGWANAGPPPRAASGQAVAAPPFGADLHYMLTAYGRDIFTQDILLGHAVAMLQEEPVLTRGTIRRALSPTPPDPAIPSSVRSARLADQVEQLRLTMANPSAEEVSRLWSAFSAPFRASVFVEVSVVLVDPLRSAAAPLPVAAVGFAALPLSRPEVEDVLAEGPPGTPVTMAATLVITGRSLGVPGTRVRLGGSEAAPITARESELRVRLQDFAPTPRAGLAGLIVARDIEIGAPPAPREALVSDAVPVALLPSPSFAADAVDISATGNDAGVPIANGRITVGVSPPVTPTQSVVLQLVELGAPADRAPRGASLIAPPRNGVPTGAQSTASMEFVFRRLPRGPYLARMVVDGVESRLTRGPAGRYDAPRVTL